MTDAPTASLTPRERVERHSWYHTIDLGDGLVTPGWFDTRSTAAKVPMPASLAGKRCLDVGTWDGFWAFEMEKRGAESVTAIDIDDQEKWDWPPVMKLRDDRRGKETVSAFKDEAKAFYTAHEIIGSRVDRRDVSVYDLDPEVHGTFDFVFLGSLLLHLRDPVRALAAVRSVTGGEAVIADSVDFWPSILRPRTPTARLEGIERPWWWQPNRAGLHQMVRSAGFEIVEATGLYVLPFGPSHPKPDLKAIPKQLRSAKGREELVMGMVGLIHAAVRVRPVR